MIENQTLYASAAKLYATRNQIAHLGELPENRDHFEMTYSDVRAALDCVRRLFKWFGVNEEFPLPDIGFITGHAASVHAPTTSE